MIVKKEVGEYIRNKGLYVSNEVFDTLELKTKKLVNSACKRAELNKRKTVYGRDL